MKPFCWLKMMLRNWLMWSVSKITYIRGFAQITQTPLQLILVVCLHSNPPCCTNRSQCTTTRLSAIIWVFEGVWVICAKPPFLHSLDVQIKMLANSLAVLNQQTLGKTDHVHCSQTLLMESCVVVWFWVDKRPACCSL